MCASFYFRAPIALTILSCLKLSHNSLIIHILFASCVFDFRSFLLLSFSFLIYFFAVPNLTLTKYNIYFITNIAVLTSKSLTWIIFIYMFVCVYVYEYIYIYIYIYIYNLHVPGMCLIDPPALKNFFRKILAALDLHCSAWALRCGTWAFSSYRAKAFILARGFFYH